MLRLLVYLLLIVAAYHLLKKYAKSFFGAHDEGQTGNPPAETEMIQDPQCGAYFLSRRGVKGVVDGKVMNFCSEECYEKYLKRKSRN